MAVALNYIFEYLIDLFNEGLKSCLWGKYLTKLHKEFTWKFPFLGLFIFTKTLLDFWKETQQEMSCSLEDLKSFKGVEYISFLFSNLLYIFLYLASGTLGRREITCIFLCLIVHIFYDDLCAIWSSEFYPVHNNLGRYMQY